jgi:hypothetical protein
MSIHRNVFSKVSLSALVWAAATAGAWAQDANAVADRFKQLMSRQGIELSWTAVTGDASAFTLEGVKLMVPGSPDSMALGNFHMEGATEANGDFRIETVTTDAYTTTHEGATIEVSPFKLSGVRLPAAGATGPLANLVIYEGAELASLNVKIGDKPAFSLQNLSAQVTLPADGKPMGFTGALEKFTADLMVVGDPQSRAMIEALGYQNISGRADVAGSWQPTDGRIGFSQYDITVDDAGTFGMTFDLGGYTPDFIKALQDMQKQMAAQPAGADNSAQGLAMLGLMQQLTFHSASLRWDDDSLTSKVIDYVAKMQNMKPEDIKNQAKAIVPFLTAQLNNPELSAALVAAVTKYLDDPGSLEIAAKPAAPVPFAQIMAAGMANPVDLTKTLSVTVTANESR